MNRRDFIKSSVVTGVAVAAGARPQAEQKPPEYRHIVYGQTLNINFKDLSDMHVYNLMHEAAEGHKRTMAELDAVREFARINLRGEHLS